MPKKEADTTGVASAGGGVGSGTGSEVGVEAGVFEFGFGVFLASVVTVVLLLSSKAKLLLAGAAPPPPQAMRENARAKHEVMRNDKGDFFEFTSGFP
jgi:hypothetical protein